MVFAKVEGRAPSSAGMCMVPSSGLLPHAGQTEKLLLKEGLFEQVLNWVFCTVQIQPRDVGQACRIGGVNPADINSLLIHLEVQRRLHSLRAPAPLSARQRRVAHMASPALPATAAR